jgi:hypothetical protein
MASDSGADDAAALRERVAALEKTVAEQQATSESPGQPTASRRGLLSGAAAAAGLGALGVYSSSPASAQAAGQVGTQSEPVDVEAYDLNVQGTANGLVQNPLAGDLDGGGNSVNNLGSVETDNLQHTGGEVVLYVRDSGDDSNDGLSAVSAKATLQGAIDAISHVTDQSSTNEPSGTVVIDVEGVNQTVTDRVNLEIPWVNIVEITGRSGGATFTVQGNQFLYAFRSGVRFQDVTVQNDGSVFQDANLIQLRRCYGTLRGDSTFSVNADGANEVFLAQWQSRIGIRDTVSIEGNGVNSTNYGLRVHSCSNVRFVGNGATIRGADSGIHIDRNSAMNGDGHTTEDCTIGIHLADNSSAKNFGTIRNCDVGIRVRETSIWASGAGTFDTVGERFDIPSGDVGFYGEGSQMHAGINARRTVGQQTEADLPVDTTNSAITPRYMTERLSDTGQNYTIETINDDNFNPQSGTIITIIADSGGNTTTFKHGVDNLDLQGNTDTSIGSYLDAIRLYYMGGNFYEIKKIQT